MSDDISKYSFLPWLRQGIAAHIKEADKDHALTGARATVKVKLKVESEDPSVSGTVENTIQIIGPGDITGLDKSCIIRTEPRNWITDIEPNFIPFIEFYDEDFPWRYTPAKGDKATNRLRPWITLIVLEEGEEFTDHPGGDPLPYIELKKDAATVLPNADELWAWAHVHSNADLGEDINTALPKLAAQIDSNPDNVYSRILSPRRLKPNTAYHAFVIPTFETGRLSGLGIDKPTTPVPYATVSAWEDYPGRPDGTKHPYYHRWFFKTGKTGDFEYLVNLLKAMPLDERVGIRDMDVSRPEGGIDKTKIVTQTLGLEGALKTPYTVSTVFPDANKDGNQDAGRDAFQKNLLAILNTPETYKAIEQSADPIITPPIYGTWHALTPKLDIANQNWVHELNLDPRFRTAAGMGTMVIRQNQEKYMEEAWKQVEGVLEANRKMNQIRLALEASLRLYEKSLEIFDPETVLQFTSPVFNKVLTDPYEDLNLPFSASARNAALPAGLQAQIGAQGSAPKMVTMSHKSKQSMLPPAMLSMSFRKITRPMGMIGKRFGLNAPQQTATLLRRTNAGEITATPPKVTQIGIKTPNVLAETQYKASGPTWLRNLAQQSWFMYAGWFMLALLIVVVLITGFAPWAIAVSVPLAAATTYAMVRAPKLRRETQAQEAAQEKNLTLAALDKAPLVADFRITKPGEVTRFSRIGTGDNTEAMLFKQALQKQFVMFMTQPEQQPMKKTFNLEKESQLVLEKLNPRASYLRRLNDKIRVPGRGFQFEDSFVPVMAYPEITLPMYEPLRDISGELLVPNLKLIGMNVISLLETNMKFIESYMMGLNHEFARELLWREYPTDQRGSYFRQFWDVREAIKQDPAMTDEAFHESLKDIKEIHKWGLHTALGSHNNRKVKHGDKQLVLVVRGELLKRYPNTVIYAHRAEWPIKNGAIDHHSTRLLKEINSDDDMHKYMMLPLYKATVAPDIFFIGFDLTVPEVIGEEGNNPSEDPGWFFVLKERPGEPRFGLDEPDEDQPVPPPDFALWKENSWNHVHLGTSKYITFDNELKIKNFKAGYSPTPDEAAEHDEDLKAFWNPNTSAADTAYILYREKAMIAVHASEMLRDVDGSESSKKSARVRPRGKGLSL